MGELLIFRRKKVKEFFMKKERLKENKNFIVFPKPRKGWITVLNAA